MPRSTRSTPLTVRRDKTFRRASRPASHASHASHAICFIAATVFGCGLLASSADGGELDSQSNPVPAGSIIIDGAIGDWAGVSCFAPDAAGDGGTGYDIAQYCIAHDDNNFYVRVGLHGEGSAALGDGAGMWTWFDTDKNFSTGIGVGAAWNPSGLGIEWNGSGLSQFNGWTAAGAHTGSILGGAVTGARSADNLNYEYAIPRSVFGVSSFYTSVQSEFGAADVLPDGVGNFFEYHAPAPPPPPILYTYETNPAIANGPTSGALLGDPGLTKLTDGIASDPNWLTSSQLVAAADPAFVPANLAGDTELPQPRVDFSFAASQMLQSVTITYLVDDEAKIHSPDYVVVSFSDAGSPFGGDIASFDFDNSDDNATDPVGMGAIRTLTLDLGGVAADKVRLDFFNDFEWTGILEVGFTPVPEPSTWLLAACGAVGTMLLGRRKLWR